MVFENVNLRQNELLLMSTAVKDKWFFEVKKKIKKDSKQSLTDLAPLKKALNFDEI